VTEYLNRDLNKLLKEIGVKEKWRHMNKSSERMNLDKSKNQIKKHFTLDEKTRQKIYKDNPLDLKLYRYAKRVRDKQR
jgi:hypothetical protein